MLPKAKPALIGLIDDFTEHLIQFGDELKTSRHNEDSDGINRTNERQLLLEDLALFLMDGITENESRIRALLDNFSIQVILKTFRLLPETRGFIQELMMAGSVLKSLKKQEPSFDNLLERQRLLENLAVSLANKLERIPRLALLPIGIKPGITRELKEFIADLIDYKRLLEKIRQPVDQCQEKDKRQKMMENLALNLSERVKRVRDRMAAVLEKPRVIRLFS